MSTIRHLLIRTWAFSLIIALTVATINVLPVSATTDLTFAPSDDASIRLDQPNLNSGSATTLVVDANPVRDFLLKFNVTGVGQTAVVSAKLRLFQIDSSPRGGDFRKTSPNWSETSVTWNNAPSPDLTIVASIARVAKNLWYEANLTSTVTGDGVVSLRASSTSSDGAYYSSKESTNPPQLVLTISGSSDGSPPSQPQSLTATAVNSGRVDLSWNASSDNVGVAGYDILRNGTKVQTVPGSLTSYADTSVSPATWYSYTVVAFDLAQNRSPPSLAALVRTPQITGISSLQFSPTDDAYVRSDTPSTNFGGDPSLIVDNSPLRDMLLKFNVIGVGSSQILSAKLRILQTDASPRGGDFHKATPSSWTENSVNWNNAPAPDPAIIASLGQVASGVWYEVDVTSAVTGDGAVSFRINSPNADGAYYSSKEGGNPPKLNVTVSGLPQSFLSLQASPNPVIAGQATTFSGTLVDGTGGGLSGRVIEVQSSLSTLWFTVSIATTETGGVYSASRAFYSPGSYQIRARYQGDSNHSASTSTAISLNATGTSPSTFSFAAAGDHDAQTETSSSLAALPGSGASFYLALGDLSYGAISPEAAWCDYVTSRVGATFPFELISGNHEDGEEEQGQGLIDNFATCLPDRIGSIGGIYGKEYFFDYPVSSPVARVIMISPNLNFTNGGVYSYRTGTTHLSWLSNTIDGARAVGIPWVIVGMHKVCVEIGTNSCEIGRDLLNLLIDKKVDLVLQGHDHSYQRSGQLALSAACTTIPISPDPANTSCIADNGSDGLYTKSAGTVFVIAGIFGAGLTPVNATDAEAPYFARFFGSNSTGAGHGFVKYSVSANGISAELILASGGSFTDTWTIVSGGTDSSPPSQPGNLTARAMAATRVNLSWTASIDNILVSRYDIYRNGTKIASVGGGTTTYSDTTISSPATYVYTVVAFDAANNPSQPSNTAKITIRQIIFVPTDDAYVRADAPTTNFGSATQLIVDASPLREILVKFNVQGVGTWQVAAAKLRLYQVDSSSNGGDFHTSGTGWSEGTVNWNNAPAPNAGVIASIGSVAPNTWYEVDLTISVSGDGLVSFRITTPSTDGSYFSSKEGGNAAQLVITIYS